MSTPQSRVSCSSCAAPASAVASAVGCDAAPSARARRRGARVRLRVEAEDGGEKHGVREAVREVELTAEWIGERVHGCGVDGAEAQAAVEACARHAFAGFGVVAIANGAREEARAERDAFERVEVDERMREAVGVCLDAVRECVEAGGRGDGGWDGVA